MFFALVLNEYHSNIIQFGQQRKREIRLMKNREAARECRNKKKEYIKCLENRVAVLENQNKVIQSITSFYLRILLDVHLLPSTL